MKDWRGESEAGILIAGTRNPFQIKIEITHFWGKPILHIQIVNDRIKILSFTGKKLYYGRMSPDVLSRFFHGKPLDRSLIWAISRGYPPFMAYKRIGIPERNTIHLIDREGRVVESIELDPEKKLPTRISFPDRDLALDFYGYITQGGIKYAAEIRGKSLHGGKDLILQHDNMVFNRKIPEQIFELENMPGFETVHLEETHGTKKE